MSKLVLVVDDNQRVLQTFARNLTMAGYTALTASDGDKALEIYEREWPDISFVDMRMPGLDGFAVLEAIRQQNPYAEVIIITGHGDMDTVIAALRAGASDFIPKPIAQVTLEAALARAQERLRMRQELQTARKELAKAQSLLSAAIEHTPAGILIADAPDVNIRIANSAALGIRGESVDPLTKIPAKLHPQRWQTYHPDGTPLKPEELPLSRAVLEGKISHDVEIIIQHSDGQERWVSVNAAPVYNDRDEIVAGVAVFSDITERVRSERALRIQHELAAALGSMSELTAALNCLLDAVLQFDEIDSGGVYLVDEHTGELLLACHPGLSPQFVQSAEHYAADSPLASLLMAGEPFYASCVESQLPKDEARLQEGVCAFAVLPLRCEERVVAAINLASHTFEQIPADTRAALEAIATQMGAVIARIEAEDALRRERDLAESLIETAQVIVLLLDPQGRIVRFNPYMEEISGYSLQEVQGKDWFSTFLPPENWKQARTLFQQAINDIRTRGNVIPAITKDGQRRDIEWYDKTLKDADGQVVGLLAVGQDITERLRANRVLAQHADQVALLNSVGHQIAAVLELDSVLDMATRLVHERFGYHHVGLLILDVETKEVVLRAMAGDFSDLFPENHRIKLGQGVAGWAALHGESLLANDVRRELRFINFFPNLVPTRSELSVPIRVEGETVGVLDVQSPQYDAFDEDDVLVMETLADQIAVAIKNARLYEQVQQELTERERTEQALRESEDRFRRRSAELESLYEISLRLSGQLETADLLALIVEQAVDLLGAQDGCFYIYTPQYGELVVLVARGYFEIYVGYRLKPGEGLSGKVFESRQPMTVEDYNAWSGRAAVYQDEVKFKGILAVPLLGKDGVLGVLTLGGGERKRTFDEHDVRLAELFAAQAAVALESAHLRDEIQRRVKQLSAINRAGQAIASTLDLDAVLQLVIDEVKGLVEAQGVSVLLYNREADELAFSAAVGPSSKELVGVRMPADTGIAGWVMQHQQAVLVSDAYDDQRLYKAIDGLTGLTTQSILAVPLVVKGVARGVIEAIGETPDAFAQNDLEILEGMAMSAAIAIENARLYQGEHEQRQLAETMRQISETLIATLDVDIVLDRLLEQVGRVVPNDAANIMLIQNSHVHVARRHGYDRFNIESIVDELCWPIAKMPHLVKMIETGDPVVLSDVQSQPGWADFKDWAWLRSYAAVPIRVRDQVIGFLNVDSVTPGFFNQQHAEWLRAFADQAAVALENARLFEQVQETAARLQALSRRLVEVQEEQRRYVASELHDQIGQILTGLKISLEMTMQMPSETVEASLYRALDLVNDLLRRVRDLSLDLRPAMLDDLGLLPALLWHFERFTEQTQINVLFKHIGLEGHRFSSQLETTAYRIVQEALTNVARYAGVERVMVRVGIDDVLLSLQIEDQGVGFDLDAALAAGTSSGLGGMHERAALIDGHLVIESTPGTGTLVKADLPLV